MDSHRLEHFVAVAEQGGVGRAAKFLGLAQPTLTRNIHGLEAEIGVTLFERGKSGMKLTRAGEIFLPRAKSLLLDLERALLDISAPKANEMVEIRLGTAPNFAEDLLPQALPLLLQQAPLTRVELSFATREVLVEKVRAHEIDMALCLMPNFIHAAGRDLQDFDFIPLSSLVFSAYAPHGHDVTKQVVTLAALSGYRWAIPHQMSLSYRFESAFFRAQLQVPEQAVTAPSLGLLRDVAATAGLLVMLPEQAQPDDRFQKLALPELSFQYDVGVITRRGARQTENARILTKILADMMRT